MAFSHLHAERVYPVTLSLFLLAIIFLSPAQTETQSITTESIIDRIIDASRAISRNATLATKNVATGVRRPTTTIPYGTHHFAFLEPGNDVETTAKPGSRMIVWQAEGAEAWATNILNSIILAYQEGGMGP